MGISALLIEYMYKNRRREGRESLRLMQQNKSEREFRFRFRELAGGWREYPGRTWRRNESRAAVDET